MLTSLCKIIDGISWIATRLADLAVILLVLAMVYEVAARYMFHAPTEWAFDIAYMSNGAIFLLGLGWVLRQDGHIRIDVVRNKLPATLTRITDIIIYLVILFPLFCMFSRVAIIKALYAWRTNEVEMVSPWAPLMWPFYAVIAIGLVVLSLQFLAQGLRMLSGTSVAKGEAA